jgi:hypothetical protein
MRPRVAFKSSEATLFGSPIDLQPSKGAEDSGPPAEATPVASEVPETGSGPSAEMQDASSGYVQLT